MTSCNAREGVAYPLRGKTQQELTAAYQSEVDKVLSEAYEAPRQLVVGYTPSLYEKLGMPSLPLTIGSGHVYSAAKTESEAKQDGNYKKGVHYHGLGDTAIKNIYSAIQDPVMVIAAKDVSKNASPMRSTHSVVAIVDIGTAGKSLLIPVEITAERTVNGMQMDVNTISSVYERSASGLITEAIALENSGDIGVFYAKKEALTLPAAGVQFPARLQQSIASDGIVHHLSEKVNMKISEVTQSQQFKRWFGDWQNDPANASKVVNADGTPKVMYHGTGAEFTVFDRSKGKKKIHLNVFGDGNYFTALESGAARYGQNIVPAYLDIKNPYVKSSGYNTVADQIANDFGFDRTTYTGKDVSAILKAHGYDGVVMLDGNGEIVIANAFDSNQIKSATDNLGTFDKSNPDIRFSKRTTAELLEYQKQLLEIQKNGNNQNLVDPKELRKMAQAIMQSADSKINVQELADSLQQMVNLINAKEMDQEGFHELLSMVDKVIDTLDENKPFARDAYAQSILDSLKKRKIRLSDSQIAEVKSAYGSLKAYRSMLKGTVILDQKNGMSLDGLWREMGSEYSSVFSEDVNEGDQKSEVSVKITDIL